MLLKVQLNYNPVRPLVGSIIKGTGHFFETLSVGSVPDTDHS